MESNSQPNPPGSGSPRRRPVAGGAVLGLDGRRSSPPPPVRAAAAERAGIDRSRPAVPAPPAFRRRGRPPRRGPIVPRALARSEAPPSGAGHHDVRSPNPLGPVPARHRRRQVRPADRSVDQPLLRVEPPALLPITAHAPLPFQV